MLLCFLIFQATFKIVKEWVSELREKASPQIILAIAGNKCDLEDLREVNKKGRFLLIMFMLCNCIDSPETARYVP